MTSKDLEQAASFLKMKNWDAAEELVTAVLRATPHLTEARAIHALVAQQRGDLAEAVSRWQSVIEMQPDRAEAYRSKAQCLMDMKLYKEARDALTPLIDSGRVDRLTLAQLAWIATNAKEWEDAQGLWEQFRDQYPEDRTGYLGGGVVLRSLGKLDDAEILLEICIKKFPEEFQVLLDRASLANQRQDWEEAIRRWKEMTVLFPGEERSVVGLISAYQQLGHHDEAESLFSMFEETITKTPRLLIEHAWSAFHRRDWSEAIRRWERVCELFPDEPYGSAGLATTLRESGQVARAETIFAAAVAKWPSHPFDEQYVPGPDSKDQPGVPKGEIFEFKFDTSMVFPGTTRSIVVYVPAQYRADKQACLYVAFDGLLFNAPTVFDNLIYKGEMPITIAIGISPGVVSSAEPPGNPRFERSVEFDSCNGDLGRLVMEEVIPEVERRTTRVGLPILLSKDPNDRATGGASTGAVAAFTLAWEWPNSFRRVFTAIASFVGMRSADRYAVLVRKTEPKPIRIFMQDGSHDDVGGLGDIGDWWMSNQTMEGSLTFSGYQVQHAWGHGSHNVRHATSIFPEAMRWIWKNWPEPVAEGRSQNYFLSAILQPGQEWQAVAGDYKSAAAIATNREGQVFFRDAVGGITWTITGLAQPLVFNGMSEEYAGMAFGPDGHSYVADRRNVTIMAYDMDGKASIIARGITGSHLLVNQRRDIYVTEKGAGDNTGKIWLIKASGQKLLQDSGLNNPSGIALSPDGLWLAVSERKTHRGLSYQVLPDGNIQHRRRFYWFYVPDEADNSGANDLAVDREGRIYAATRMGVQVLDRNGRVRAILPTPGGEVFGLTFGGERFDTLYVSCMDRRIYRRKLKASGAPPWAARIQLPPWSAG